MAWGEGQADGKAWGENDGHADGDGRGDGDGLGAEMVTLTALMVPGAVIVPRTVTWSPTATSVRPGEVTPFSL